MCDGSCSYADWRIPNVVRHQLPGLGIHRGDVLNQGDDGAVVTQNLQQQGLDAADLEEQLGTLPLKALALHVDAGQVAAGAACRPSEGST